MYAGKARLTTFLALLSAACSERAGEPFLLDLLRAPPAHDYLAVSSTVHIPEARRLEQSRLVTHSVVSESASLHRVSSLSVRDSIIVVTDRMGSPHISLLSRSTGSVLTRLGVHGEGRAEFLDPIIIPREAHTDRVVRLFDLRSKRVSDLDLNMLKLGGQPRERISVRSDHPLLGVFEVGREWLVAGLFGDFLLVTVDTLGTTARRLHLPLPFDSTSAESTNSRARLNKASVLVADRGRLTVIAYQHAARVDFVKMPLRTYSSVTVGDEITVSFTERTGRLSWTAVSEFAYVDLAATQKHIYVLYCGCTYASGALPEEVHVFTKDGSFVRALRLDAPVLQFTVSDDDKVLVGVALHPMRLLEWLLPVSD